MQTSIPRETKTVNGQGQIVRAAEARAVDGQGQIEKRVDTVNYYSSPGQGRDSKPTQVIHQTQVSSVTESNSNTSGGVLANAAASVASTLESAKQALSRK